ncbi:MAG: murein transglycosylase A [Hyphomicrobiaceae bacterium]
MEKTRKRGVVYEPIAFSELPGWDDDDHLAGLKAFIASCPRVLDLRKATAGRGRKSQTPKELVEVCHAALALPSKITRKQARAFLEEMFRPQRVVHDKLEGLLTSYYEPLLHGSRTRHGKFQTPILKRPKDLVTAVPETSGKTAHRGVTHGRRTASGISPLPTRAEIAAGALAHQNLELLYLQSPVDLYFLQIQGSGKIQLRDGSIARVSYDGKNGHAYTSIGRYLIDKGLVAAHKMSMGALGRWLKADPARGQMVMNLNASYVFFKETPAEDSGPPGAMGTPLIAGRSLAVDPGVHALGSPIYVSTPTLVLTGTTKPFRRLMVAQDVGAAIKGPERGDIFMGSGDKAQHRASRVRHPGNLFVFLPRSGVRREAAVPGQSVAPVSRRR